MKAQQEEQREAPCPPLPNSQPRSPPLCSLAHKVGPRAAAQAMLLRVISLKNSLLPTSFLCRVMRCPSASCCLSQQSGSNLRDATWDSHPRAMAYVARGPPAAAQQPRRCWNLPPPCPELQSQLTGTERTRTVQSESGWSTRQKHEVPASWLRANDSFPNAHSPPLPLIPPQCHGESTLWKS